MDQRIIDWLRLQSCMLAGAKTCSLIKYFGSASAVLSVSRSELLKSGHADEATADRILNSDESKARETAAVCEKNGWSIITPESEFYPANLKKIKDFPFVLYCDGDIQLLKHEPKISIVGTRSPSETGLMAAYLLGGCLSSLGIVTVSGGAVGIDSASHEGVLTGNGGTIAVLGCGLGSDYLPENVFMRNRIKKNGLLLSELPPFAEPSRYTFPRRNRIISALSEITVVAQSGVRGGSLITADYARKQGRTVCCFSEDIVKSPGCSQLIKDGAKVFSTPGELLAYCPKLPAAGLDPAYLDYELKNEGIRGVHIIKLSSMTADNFAAYNGITPQEAQRVLGKKLKQSKIAGAVVPESQTQSVEKEKNIKKASPERKKTAKKEPAAPPAQKTDAVLPETLSDEAKTVFAALETEPRYFDEIQYKTSLSAQEVMTAVTELELEGLAVLSAGNRVSKT